MLIKNIAVLCWAPMSYAITVGVAGPADKQDKTFCVGKGLKKVGTAALMSAAALVNPATAQCDMCNGGILTNNDDTEKVRSTSSK